MTSSSNYAPEATIQAQNSCLKIRVYSLHPASQKLCSFDHSQVLRVYQQGVQQLKSLLYLSKFNAYKYPMENIKYISCKNKGIRCTTNSFCKLHLTTSSYKVLHFQNLKIRVHKKHCKIFALRIFCSFNRAQIPGFNKQDVRLPPE